MHSKQHYITITPALKTEIYQALSDFLEAYKAENTSASASW
ncbi:hypothetical protein HMPREF1551_00727 [Capnocytophaga sp. oral taxon 863 str. F0517]|nr:hypothetical protein HMPREF1551_00727 [Capnocytophaga sp. oral taxon 863 str. F0517]